MLNIYRGSELTDREKFIFQHIKGSTLLLVPDQFSLQAERDAFFYLQEKSLMDLRVVDFSSLGAKAVRQTDGRQPQLIDKHGRHMLLARILGSCADELKLYRSMKGRNSFIDMLNSAISEMKRYNVTPEDLEGALTELEGDSYIKYKLEDILKIYRLYQEQIAGRYLDSEDYITFYGDRILEAPMVRESEVWIYGFDTFTPKNMEVIERLTAASRGVNIVMTWESGNEAFELTDRVIGQLVSMAGNAGHQAAVMDIEGEKRSTVWDRIESGKNAAGHETTAPLTLVRTSNIYAEADRAAAYILKLVREEGYRYSDIAVVCNDTDTRGAVLRRTFARWGIPAFMDRKRTVLHHQAVSFLLMLTEAAVKGYRDEAVMGIVKSALMGFEDDDRERLENYVREFRIRGSMWKRPFERGADSYGDDELRLFNGLREAVVDVIEGVKERMGTRNTAGEKVRGLYDFLEKDMDMIGRLELIAARQEEMGFVESAAQTAQSWNVICDILDQIVDICGDERISGESLLELMTAGFGEIEIGIVPASPDCVVIGTLQRTRMSRLKTLMIVGANEGVLPLDRADEGLLSEREKELLRSMEIEVSKRDDVARMEERLAVYRMMCLPEEHIYVSCCGLDEKGEEMNPSEVFTRLAERYGEADENVSFMGDLADADGLPEAAASREGALPYMAEAVRRCRDGEGADESWLQVLNWYGENDPQDLRRIVSGMDFDNRLEALGERFADSLYRGDRTAIEVSASRLEKYSSCPFAHFIMYGLRAEEPRLYEVGAREIGDVYHRCLMTLSRRLTPDSSSGITVDDPASPWMTIGEEECRRMVSEIIADDAKRYREGLLSSGREEGYRAERISEICGNIAWVMIQQVRKGSVKAMAFEYPFGMGGQLPPVRVDAGDIPIYIRGKIDRLDVIEGDRLRIIDYKTGSDKISEEYFRSGYKLQLMVYMKAALEGSGGETYKPAGVFYFRIKDIYEEAGANAASQSRQEMEDRLENAYKLEGIVLNDEELIKAMDRDMDGSSTSSHVIPVKVSKKYGGYVQAGGGRLMSDEEFGELYRQVDMQVRRICGEICSGSVDIRPKREKNTGMNACRYCGYKSVCVFDTSFVGCRYEPV